MAALQRRLSAVEQSARTAMPAVSPAESAGMTAGVASKTARSTCEEGINRAATVRERSPSDVITITRKGKEAVRRGELHSW